MPGTPERLQLLRDQLSRVADISTADLWRLMPFEERKLGVLQACAGHSGESASRAVRTFLKRSIDGFRPQSIDLWDGSTLASRTARMASVDESIVVLALVGLFIDGDRSIQRTFFTAAGVTHVDGVLADSGDSASTYAASQVEAGVDAVLAGFPDSPHALLYLLTLSVVHARMWTGITRLLTDLFTPGIATDPSGALDGESSPVATSFPTHGTEPEPRGESALELPSQEASRPPKRRRQTNLDRVLIQQAVSASANSPDAIPLSVMAGVVEEFVRAQPLRHQSYFHLGFVDALLGDPAREELPSENAVRWRWYDAGWISGRWRRKDWPGIAKHFDDEPRVRTLGDGGEASEYATSELLTALVELDRHAEAARFVSPSAYLARGVTLPREVLDIATTLLRDDRAGEARPYLGGLELGLDVLRDAGFVVDSDLVFDLQRRLAHCLRHEGLYSESKMRLEELLAGDADIEPRYDAMVSADIGLIEGGIRRLSEIKLGADRGEADEVVRSLNGGASRFAHAAAQPCPESAHGRYPLGIIALTESRYSEALPHLESALSLFAGNPERYSGGGLIFSCRFYAALAGMASDTAAPRALQFLEWIKEGLATQRSIPNYLLEDVLLGALVKDPVVAAGLVHELVMDGREETLEQVAQVAVQGAERVVAIALLGRFDKRRPATDADAALLERSLTLAESISDSAIALRALTHLQDLAAAGIGHARLVALLENDAAAGWLLDDDERSSILLKLHESLGQYDRAAIVIDRIGHRLLSGEGYANADQVDDLLERGQGYPSDSRTLLEALKARLTSMRTAAPATSSSAPVSLLHASICIVGGNEIQAQYQDRLREWARGENLTLHFITSGWSSNWGDYVKEFERHVDNGLNGVVILQFIRTELGRAIRKRCEKIAQIGTWGHGEQSMRRAAAQVAGMARRQMQSRVS